MAKPVILVVDDDPMVLSAVDRDLRKKYGPDYRIAPINMGSAALEYLKQLQGRAEAVALFLVDQRMPRMRFGNAHVFNLYVDNAIISGGLWPRRFISGNSAGATVAMSDTLEPEMPETMKSEPSST